MKGDKLLRLSIVAHESRSRRDSGRRGATGVHAPTDARGACVPVLDGVLMPLGGEARAFSGSLVGDWASF